MSAQCAGVYTHSDVLGEQTGWVVSLPETAHGWVKPFLLLFSYLPMRIEEFSGKMHFIALTVHCTFNVYGELNV